jgi:hypothetical protein
MNRPPGTRWRSVICGTLWGAVTLWVSPPIFAQELELRRWNHLPIDRNFVTGNYAHTEGDIAFDPVLGIEDAVVEMDTWLFGYVRTFELLDRSARVEIRQAWQEGQWSGLVNGTPASVEREGLADTVVRLGVNLLGAPPLAGKAYAEYRAATEVETIVGAGLVVQLPTGDYLEDKLINLGSNRFTFRPQLGVQHQHHNWSFEATAMAWIYTDNTSFLVDGRLEQDPLYTLDGSVVYTFDSGIWVSANAGIGVGGQTSVNGVENDDRREDVGWAVGIGFPVTRSLGLRATYIESDRWKAIGNDSQTISIGLTASW